MFTKSTQYPCICIYTHTLFLDFLLIKVTTGHWIWFPMLNSRLLLSIIYFIHSSVCMSFLSSFPIFPTVPSPFGNHKFILCICDSVYAFPINSSMPFYRFPIQAILCNICSSLSDLFYSLWQSLGPSMSLKMTLFLFIAE